MIQSYLIICIDLRYQIKINWMKQKYEEEKYLFAFISKIMKICNSHKK